LGALQLGQVLRAGAASESWLRRLSRLALDVLLLGTAMLHLLVGRR
jgi:hypothetical protein